MFDEGDRSCRELQGCSFPIRGDFVVPALVCCLSPDLSAYRGTQCDMAGAERVRDILPDAHEDDRWGKIRALETHSRRLAPL